MKTNVGNLDKVIRIGLAVGAVALGIWVHWAFYFLAGALLVTALTGFCGLYAFLGLSTCPRKSVKTSKPL